MKKIDIYPSRKHVEIIEDSSYILRETIKNLWEPQLTCDNMVRPFNSGNRLHRSHVATNFRQKVITDLHECRKS